MVFTLIFNYLLSQIKCNKHAFNHSRLFVCVFNEIRINSYQRFRHTLGKSVKQGVKTLIQLLQSVLTANSCLTRPQVSNDDIHLMIEGS